MQKLALSLIMTALLAACSSTPTSQEGTTAPITDGTSGSTTAGTSGDAVNGSDLSKNPLTDPNNILSQRRVYFDYDSFVVKSDYSQLVEAHSKYLRGNPNARVIVQGHTDNRGTAEYNLALGQKRADAVRRMMNAYGVADSQIETVSYGEEKPLEEGDSETAYERNRRAEIVYQGE
ncbi:peptidoglycan-associated lipoprotein Pal [Chitinibacteraceae bacterium HSL-7]